MKRVITTAAGLAACIAIGCSSTPNQASDVLDLDPEPAAAPAADGGAQGTTTKGKDGGGEPPPDTCPYSGPKIDVSGFAACGDGGRCVPSGFIPDDQKARLAACANGFCVPQKIIENKGLYLPKSCTSVFGGEGRCTSLVFPDLEKQKDSLPQDVCDPNERCAPCFDPHGTDTGACRSVACDAPKQPAKTFTKCCTSSGKPRGLCLPKSGLPAQAASGLGELECQKGVELCVPEEMMDPKYVPPKCTGQMPLLGDYDGVCMSDCIPRDFLGQLMTSQGSCTAGSFCAPCKNPLTQQSTGAPGCAP